MSVPILPNYLVQIAVEPKLKTGQAKLKDALQRLEDEDPTFHAEADRDSGQMILNGNSELHLNEKIDALYRQHQIEVNCCEPQVIYRETITKLAKIDYTHERHVGGAGQYARVKFIVEPGEKTSGLLIENKTANSAVPKEYLTGVEKGLQSVMASGDLTGSPVVGIRVKLLDGTTHEIDSSAAAFQIASATALREAIANAGPVLLEPMMRVEVVSSEDYLGWVVGDLNNRRGLIEDVKQSQGKDQILIVTVPLANMFGYSNDLHTMTQGRATHTMSFDRYQIKARSSYNPDPDDDLPTAMAMRA